MCFPLGLSCLLNHSQSAVFLYLVIFVFLFACVVLATLPELCYITTMLMGQGDTLLRTTMHGIVLNILHSLTMLPELSHSGKCLLFTVYISYLRDLLELLIIGRPVRATNTQVT